MTARFKMDETYPRKLDQTAQGVIGKPISRRDGPIKVSGQATYAAEQEIEGVVNGFLVRATIAKGTVTSIKNDDVLAMPGVLGVFSAEKFLRNPAQGTANEAPVQGVQKVAYLGQPIALVVAETFEQARHAAQTLQVDYDGQNAVVNPGDKAAAIDKPEGNQMDQGDLDAAMKTAVATIDAIYTTPGHSSAPMEPHNSTAVWDDGKLTVYGSYQMLKYNQNELADSLGIKPDDVRIVCPFVGGGFGSKLGIAPEAVAAALAAKELGRPVRVVMTRPQVFEGTMRRTETEQRIQLAADENGKLVGLAHHACVSQLPDEDFSEPVAAATHFLYGGQSRRYTHEIARVHRMAAGSVRAPGEAVGMLALENAMDELAVKLDMDPVELRRRNIPEKHPEKDIPYSARSLAECLATGAKRFGWGNRNAKPASVRDGEWFVGMGMSVAARSNILSESAARVTINASGTATVETDMTDIGTGTYTILGQIAGEMLGINQNAIDVRLGDTDFPKAAGSGGSWGASSSGSSVLIACQALREELAQQMQCDEADLTLKDGTAISGNRQVSLDKLLNGKPLQRTGEVEPGSTMEEFAQAGYGAHFAEVAVNSVTGETRVRRMLGVFAAGRILNEKTARSQCEGGMVWGIGTALTEELVHDHRDGHIVNHNLDEYHIPVNLDVPQLEVVFIEERDDQASPLQSKGIGELGISGAGAAITNAIYNACGVRVRDYPATLDKIIGELPE